MAVGDIGYEVYDGIILLRNYISFTKKGKFSQNIADIYVIKKQE